MNGVTAHFREGFKVFEVNTRKVFYKGFPWRALSEFQKRKFENLLVLSSPNDQVKIIYG